MTFVLFMLILPLSGPIYPSLREGPLCGGEPAVRPMQVKGGFQPTADLRGLRGEGPLRTNSEPQRRKSLSVNL